MVLAQFTLKMCIQFKVAENSVKTLILGVQGRSRSSMLVPLESSPVVLVMVSSKFVSICNRFHARWANSGKITISKGWVPLFDALVQGESFHPVAPNLSRKKLWDSRLSYCGDQESLSHPALNPYRVVSDRQTGRQTDGQTEFP